LHGYNRLGRIGGGPLPLYEYRCLKCGTHIERIQKFSDSPLVKCGQCGGKLERLISASAIQFKGSGWYVTDYARKSAPAEATSSGKNDAAPKDKTDKAKTPAPVSTATKPAESKSSSDK
jgi:putative FmdB family regulatory protein